MHYFLLYECEKYFSRFVLRHYFVQFDLNTVNFHSLFWQLFILSLTQTFLYILVEVPKAAGFREFLKTLKKPAAQDVNDKCKVWVSNS